MRRPLVAAFCLALSASPSSAASASVMTEDEVTEILNACAPDISAHCADARRAGRRLIACFVANQAEIGPRCRTRIEATPSAAAILRNYANFLTQSCSDEAARFCEGVAPGRGRLAACLGAREERLSPACANALNASGF